MVAVFLQSLEAECSNYNLYAKFVHSNHADIIEPSEQMQLR